MRNVARKIRFGLWQACTVAVVTLTATAASADDLRSMRDDPYDRPLIWSGAFVGAHLGGRWGDYSVKIEGQDDEFAKAISLDPQSVIGGLQVGYNIPAGHVVLGIEADVSFANSRDSFTDEWTVATRVELGAQGTLTARLGLPVGQFMPYIKGGLAWTQISVYGALLQDGAAYSRHETQASETLAGWAIGGGLEYALRGNWTARAEYLFTDFGSLSTISPEGDSFRHDLNTHSVLFGLNYRLGD
jgi:outer membrane immunogenic protein